MCPACGGKNVFPGEYDIEHRECHDCTWGGHVDALKSHEFWVERVALIEISWDDINEIVRTYYGHGEFEMVVNGEWGNDSSHQFDVEPVVDNYAKKDAEKFRRGDKPRDLSNGDVLNILCEDGWLEPGQYLVEVCW
jgi:hypothetical protein